MLEKSESNKFGKTYIYFFILISVAAHRNQCYFSSVLIQQSNFFVAVDISLMSVCQEHYRALQGIL